MQTPINVGDFVQVAGKDLAGRVRFVGETKFAAGEWLGVEVDEPVGKNDGSVQGMRYFQCAPCHGVFLRPKHVTKVAGPARGPFQARAASFGGVSRRGSSLGKATGAVRGSLPSPGELKDPPARRASQIRKPSAPSCNSSTTSGADAPQLSDSTSPSLAGGSNAEGAGADVRAIEDPVSKSKKSLEEERVHAQHELAQAAECHSVHSICTCLARASKLGVAANELDAAWRILNFEVDQLYEAKRELEEDNAAMVEHITCLEEQLETQKPQTAAELPKERSVANQQQTSSLAEMSGSREELGEGGATHAEEPAEVRRQLQAASAAVARLEGQLAGQQQLAEKAMAAVSAELRAEVRAASDLRARLSAHEEAPPPPAWLRAVSQAVAEVTKPLLQELQALRAPGRTAPAPAAAATAPALAAEQLGLALAPATAAAVAPLVATEQLGAEPADASKAAPPGQEQAAPPPQGLAAAPAEQGALAADPEPGCRTRHRCSHRLPQLTDVNWSLQVAVPERYCGSSIQVPDTHCRGITLEQLDDLGSLVQQVLDGMPVHDPRPASGSGRITWANVNLYHINELFVLQLTRQQQCSFVELIAPGVQEPRWFVSHWWGTPFRDSLCMLNFHAQSHKLPPATPYWICTFANNQHNLEELDQRDLMQTPFARAIMSSTCEGTVMLMNNSAEPFRRTWCTLENYVSTTCARREKRQEQLLEVAAVIPDGEQVVQLDGAEMKIPRSPALLMDDGQHNLIDKVEVEGAWFPSAVARQGVKADIAKANASNEEDKRSILRLIIGVDDREDMPEPPETHDKYDAVNRAIHTVFAPRALYEAAQDGHLAEAQRILAEQLCSPDQPNSLGETPLWTAAFHNHAKVLELLLAQRAMPDQANSHAATPLFAAASRAALKAMGVLLRAGADPNLPDDHGTTPVFWPAQQNQAEVMELLLTARASPNSVDHQGGTPVHVAAFAGHEDALELLLEARAEVDQRNRQGLLPMSLAAQGGHSAVLDLLLEAQADPNSTDGDGATVLSWAAYNADADSVRVLLAARADANVVVGGETALDCVCAGQEEGDDGRRSAVKEALLAAGAKRFAEL